jgi:fermentation-respiration switch protein FrsA (DUF1100 family)
VVAGELDRHTTLAESNALFAAAAAPKELWIVAGAHHQDFLTRIPTAIASASSASCAGTSGYDTTRFS